MESILRFKSEGPVSISKSLRIGLPVEPVKITICMSETEKGIPYISAWDAPNKILKLDFENQHDGVDVEIKW